MANMDTGAIMAAIRYREMQNPEPLYGDTFAAIFATEQSFKDLEEIKEKIPYYERMLSVRHKLFLELSKTLLEGGNGITQVVSLGAGYCSMVHDLIQGTEIAGFEVDRDEVCQKKSGLIQGYLPKIISMDLEAGFEFQDLVPFCLDLGKATLCIMQGVLYYFKNMEEIFGFMSKLSQFLIRSNSILLFDMQVGDNPLSEEQRQKTKESGMNDCFYPLSYWSELFENNGLVIHYFSKVATADRWKRLNAYKRTKSSIFVVRSRD